MSGINFVLRVPVLIMSNILIYVELVCSTAQKGPAWELRLRHGQHTDSHALDFML